MSKILSMILLCLFLSGCGIDYNNDVTQIWDKIRLGQRATFSIEHRRTYEERYYRIERISKETFLNIREKNEAENFEYNVLRGTKKILQRCHPYLFVEAKSDALKQRIDKYLATFGYKSTARFNPPSPTYFYEVVDRTKEK